MKNQINKIHIELIEAHEKYSNSNLYKKIKGTLQALLLSNVPCNEFESQTETETKNVIISEKCQTWATETEELCLLYTRSCILLSRKNGKLNEVLDCFKFIKSINTKKYFETTLSEANCIIEIGHKDRSDDLANLGKKMLWELISENNYLDINDNNDKNIYINALARLTIVSNTWNVTSKELDLLKNIPWKNIIKKSKNNEILLSLLSDICIHNWVGAINCAKSQGDLNKVWSSVPSGLIDYLNDLYLTSRKYKVIYPDDEFKNEPIVFYDESDEADEFESYEDFSDSFGPMPMSDPFYFDVIDREDSIIRRDYIRAQY